MIRKVAFVLLLLPIILAGRAAHRRKGAAKILLWIVTVLLLLVLLALPFTIIYRAGDTAKAVLPDTEMKLGSGMHAWVFDGPGENAALVFYPGAMVDAASYTPLMARIAEGGADCFLIEMPLHFALLGVNAADRIMETYDYACWILAGHSLGGVAASSYAHSHTDAVAGVVLLASYPTVELENMPLLTIYGDRDAVLNREAYEERRALWPEGAEELVIPGGNHAQFGDYGPQRGDGEAAITKDEQQMQTAEAILHWIQTHISKEGMAA